MKTITEFLNAQTIDIDLVYAYEDGQTFEEFEEKVQDLIRQTDVIYYASAMDYLRENDPSLSLSLGLAGDLCYEPSSLNSEILATLLKQDNLQDEWGEIYSEVEQHFQDVEERIEEIEERLEEISSLLVETSSEALEDREQMLRHELAELKEE